MPLLSREMKRILKFRHPTKYSVLTDITEILLKVALNTITPVHTDISLNVKTMMFKSDDVIDGGFHQSRG